VLNWLATYLQDVSDDAMKNGLEVLLKRMESNPAEFTNPDTKKWGWAINPAIRRAQQGYPEHTADLPFLSDDEVRQIYAKWLALQGELFTEKVLKTLLADSEPDQRVPKQLELDLLAHINVPQRQVS
jgi:hypothetical protein